MKRFWDQAAVVAAPQGYGVQLDGKPVRLPSGGSLVVASAPLAEALAAEWNRAGGAKGGEWIADDLPLTRLVGTAADRIAPDPMASVMALAQYGETDLLCYRAEDERLAARQEAAWQPLLDWAALHLDAPLRSTAGLMPVEQEAASLVALQAQLARFGALDLAALGVAVPVLGSLVLGLALAHGRLDAEEAYRLATLDEQFQEEFWGTDPEATAKRAAAAADLRCAAQLLELARGAGAHPAGAPA